MINHEPECPWPDEPCGHEPMHDRQPVFCVACLTECICDRLRACEQRVRQETFDADWSEMGQLAAVRLFRKQAYVAGLDAAREAVLNAGLCAPHRCQSDALAAIDALREEEPCAAAE